MTTNVQNQQRFSQAIQFALDHEISWTRDPAADPNGFGVHHDDPPPFNRLLGPVFPRGGVSGLVLQNQHEVCRWGTPERSDQTFSVAKTYLALLAGVAHADGLLPSLNATVVSQLPGIGFDHGHNRSITWLHLLNQVSEWEGSCFGLPDTVDRYRKVAHDPKKTEGVKGSARPLQQPGSYWEYNDVRINQLSLALMHLFGRSLAEVFQQRILNPINASGEFAWDGYDQSWVEMPASGQRAAQKIQSVPGGTHWGGGVRINAIDQAKIGQLLLQSGQWNGHQLLPSSWVQSMFSACSIANFYGMLTWLNPGGTCFPGASEQSRFMVGAGGNYVWIEPAHQAVVVVRWLSPEYFSGFLQRMSKALAL